MEPSVEYSNIDPDLLVYEGKQYDHLKHVLDEQTQGVRPELYPDKYRIVSSESGTERQQEDDLLSKDKSKCFEQLANFGISFKEISMGPVSIDLNLLVPAAIQAGSKMFKALQPFGNTRVDDALTFGNLGAVTPYLQHLVRLGNALEYDKPFEISKTSGLQLTHASSTFEEAATLMPILHALVFCGSLYNGNDFVGSHLRRGFTLGLFPTTKGGNYIVRHRTSTVRQLVDEMWRKGTCYTASAADKAQWERWKECNEFDPRTRAKGSCIRDLVRFCWNKYKVAFVVQDMESAAIAFGLAQVGLCRIDMLNLGPVGGVTVFGYREHQRNAEDLEHQRNAEDLGHQRRAVDLEHQRKAVYLEPSLYESSHITFSYSLRRNIFDTCKVPIEHEAFLMSWLDDQIDKTHLLGIANGDPPGTVILTPEFCKLTCTGLLKYLGPEIEKIAIAVSKKCTVCEGSCTNHIYAKSTINWVLSVCATARFLNMVVTIYVGGVLLKAGMNIDQCTICSLITVVVRALGRLQFAPSCGLESLLACWFVLRTGKDAPPINAGSVLGIEMEGQVHGLRHAIEPGTTGSPLVSFPGHIYEGRQTSSCLVFEPCYRSNDIMMEEARNVVIIEQEPDVELQQLLFIRSKPEYIAVDTCLAYPDGRIVQVQLNEKKYSYKKSRHRCVDKPEHLQAIPLHVSECTDGSSIVDTQSTGLLRYVVYTYGNEAIQSWVCGLFPAGNVVFQGCRSLAHSLALLEPGDILIQGWSNRSNAMQDGQNLETVVAQLSIQQ